MFSRRRPLIAAVLAFLYPGLGHLYLRAWIRSISWFLLAFLTVSVFILPEMSTPAESGFMAMYDEFTSLPAATLFPLFMVNAFNVLDAYLLGRRQTAESTMSAAEMDDSGVSCPNCGRELDEELDFCPWCSTKFEEDEGEEPTTSP